MLRTRVIPALLLLNESLVKTYQFGKYRYIGDPCNTLRIFNELEVDELIILDIAATRTGCGPNFELLTDIANECFMPLCYGGGISEFDQAKRIFNIGFEKVSLNSSCFSRPELVTKLSEHYGSQAVIASIDVKKNMFGKYEVMANNGKVSTKRSPIEWAEELESLGAGEILLTSIDKEGTWDGYDIDLVKQVSEVVSVPVIANGGAGSVEHARQAVKDGNASAVAMGSCVVFQKKGMGVLVNFPEPSSLKGLSNDCE
ncbi:AglZ/HisF2 family acetamidino modification protein [Pleionea sp. CnH1-48]|uniref:AglZ/HisF2 family acetamidino modification protein n=1 Tax=Pleionea sp. CnH1-48 TaxID=2954494 RepID=UPI0020975825|nr:AglZ/HisF2 family acetamidino modification protein [Pleionea sp. CnH1-48]MCO7223797.1 AglZ/HisF2 family acetamidino modification protein [Pleionea sp. CnH1-48]